MAMIEIPKATCWVCKERKPLTEFHRINPHQSARVKTCKDCQRHTRNRAKVELGDTEAKDFVNWNEDAIYV